MVEVSVDNILNILNIDDEHKICHLFIGRKILYKSVPVQTSPQIMGLKTVKTGLRTGIGPVFTRTDPTLFAIQILILNFKTLLIYFGNNNLLV